MEQILQFDAYFSAWNLGYAAVIGAICAASASGGSRVISFVKYAGLLWAIGPFLDYYLLGGVIT